MYFEKVVAESFGPFRGKELALKPGFTLVHGPNESGKSTWHSAIYYALCGKPSGKLPAKEKQLLERYHPWASSNGCRVSVVVQLVDGRRVEIMQDLIRPYNGKATDAATGQVYTEEITSKGAPDGAQWLGLDRSVLHAVAWVRQAQILEVVDNFADSGLKVYLGKAIVNPDGEGSVEIARSLIDAYRKSEIGSKSYGNTRWREAQKRCEIAQSQLKLAQETQVKWQALCRQEEEYQEKLRRTERALLVEQARTLREDLLDLQKRFKEVKDLAELFPDGEPTEPDQKLYQRVRDALRDREQLPLPAELQGETAEQLRARIALLPPMPAGDLSVALEVSEAYNTWKDAKARVDAHMHLEPRVDPSPDVHGATSAELYLYAATLQQPRPALPHPPLAFPLWLSVGGGSLLFAGGLALLHAILPALVLLAAGAIALVFVLSRWLPFQAERAFVQKQLASYEQQRDQIEQWLQEHHLPTESLALRDLADKIDRTDQQMHNRREWDSQWQTLYSDLTAAENSLWNLLYVRGIDHNGDIHSAYDQYQKECGQRDSQAALAIQRDQLLMRLRDREQLERQAAEALEKRRAVTEELQRIAAQLEFTNRDESILPQLLQSWLMTVEQEFQCYREQSKQWSRFQELLNGDTLESLQQKLSTLTHRYQEACSALRQDPGDLALAPMQDLAQLEQERVNLDKELQTLKGRLLEIERNLPSIDEAEHELQAAKQEIARLSQLDQTLTTVECFLSEAARAVHRSVAEHLNPFVSEHLPLLTQGRYQQVLINPEDLSVTIKLTGGLTPKARQLSHGTTEQIYLLLRIAMAQLLTKRGEICPLICDDITVHCDAERKRALLDFLHNLSRERQVILFSQEDAVLSWAEQHLIAAPDRDGIIRLERVPLPD